MVTKEQLAAITRLNSAILRQLKHQRRFPVRLDSEDYHDILQEGIITSLELLNTYNPDRGSLGAYMARPVVRAMLACAWAQANVGITGSRHAAIQIWSADEHPEVYDIQLSDDVAEEIEAFDHIYFTYLT